MRCVLPIPLTDSSKRVQTFPPCSLCPTLPLLGQVARQHLGPEQADHLYVLTFQPLSSSLCSPNLDCLAAFLQTYSSYDPPPASTSGSAALLSLIRIAKTAPARPSFSPSTASRHFPFISPTSNPLTRASWPAACSRSHARPRRRPERPPLHLDASFLRPHLLRRGGAYSSTSWRHLLSAGLKRRRYTRLLRLDAHPHVRHGSSGGSAIMAGGLRCLSGRCAGEADRSVSGLASFLTLSDLTFRATRSYLRQTQPAFPILDTAQFSSSDPAQLATNGVSYGLLTSLLAHSTCYVRYGSLALFLPPPVSLRPVRRFSRFARSTSISGDKSCWRSKTSIASLHCKPCNSPSSPSPLDPQSTSRRM